MSDADPFIRRYALDGSQEAFAAFVRETAPPLQRFLLRLLGHGDPALLEELAQRTYVAAARKACSYHGPSATAWLLGFAFREVRTHRREVCRRRTREVIMPDQELSGLEEAVDRHTPGPVEAVEEKERTERLRSALDQLDLRARLALELVHLEGLAYADAARVLSVPAGTVKSRVHRALEALRRRLGPPEATPCLAFLRPDRAADFGPEPLADLGARTETWTRSALESIAAQGTSSSAPATPATTTERTVWTGITSNLSAQLWLAGGLILLAALPVVLWQIQSGREPIAQDRGEVPGMPEVKAATRAAAPVPKPPPEAKEPAGDNASPPSVSRADEREYFWARGVVLDAHGRPMEGVDLRVTDSRDDLSAFPGDPAQVVVWVAGHSGPSRSGPDGRFAIPFLERSRDGTTVSVTVTLGETAPVEIIQSAELRTLRARGRSSSSRPFRAFPLGAGTPSEPAPRIDGQVAEDGEGTLRFGLPPGSYGLHLPVAGRREPGEPHRFGSLLRVTVEPGAGARVEEPPPSGVRLSVVVADALLETRTLTIEGRTEDGLPVELRRLEASRGRFDIISWRRSFARRSSGSS